MGLALSTRYPGLLITCPSLPLASPSWGVFLWLPKFGVYYMGFPRSPCRTAASLQVCPLTFLAMVSFLGPACLPGLLFRDPKSTGSMWDLLPD